MTREETMAIKALSQQTEDAINRQAAIKAIYDNKDRLKIAQAIRELPSVIPGRPTGHWIIVHERKFEKIVVEYPPKDLCAYPECRGKPYFSIKYEENGEHFIGFGTYKPEVLSSYLQEYFIAPTINEVIRTINVAPSVNPQEQKTGHWILTIEDWNKWTCSECGFSERTDIHVTLGYHFCPKCGAKMESEESDADNN